MKNKIWLIIIGIIVVVGAVFLTLWLNQKPTGETDAQRFASEYILVDDDNVFVYRDIDEIIKIMRNGTGVVYLGFPECPWCQKYVTFLNKTAKEVGLDKIYYFNIAEDRTNNTEKYQEIVSILGDNLQYDEEGNLRIFVPNVSFHIDGELIGNDYETSKDTLGYKLPDDYWTSERTDRLMNTLREYMQKIVKANADCETVCDA